MLKQTACVMVMVLVAVAVLKSQEQQQPMTQDEVRDLIKKNKKDPDVVFKTLDERKVDFDLDRKIEEKMRKAGADDDMLQAIWKVGPTSRSPNAAVMTGATGAKLHAGYEEAVGYKTLEEELDPDRRLRMADEFASRFPNSQLLPYVFAQAAEAYQQKRDLNRAVEYGEKSLKLDPDNILSLLLVAVTLPQPRMLQDKPELATQRLAAAQEYANHALKLLDVLVKSANETDEQFQKRKSNLSSEAHTALATVYMQGDNLGKAAEEFNAAISQASNPNPQLYFRLGEVYENAGKKAEAIKAFSKAADLGQGTVLQKYAEDRIASLKKQ